MRFQLFIDRALLMFAAHTTSGEDLMDLQPNEPDKGTTVDLPNPDAPTVTQPQSSSSIIGDLEHAAQTAFSAAKAEVKSVFQTVETDALAVIGNLGHVRKALDSFSFSPELGAAKDYVNQAIIAIAQHVGG